MKKIVLMIFIFMSLCSVAGAENPDCNCELVPEFICENDNAEEGISLFANRGESLDEYVRRCIINYEKEINISSYRMSLSKLERWFVEFVHSNGDLPISPLSLTYNMGTFYIGSIKPVYLYGSEELHNSKMEALDDYVGAVCEYVSEGDNAVEKLLLAHDKISKDYYYDPDISETEVFSHTAYGFIENGYAVCQGYSYLYAEIADTLGIDNSLCVSLDINHIWNRVKIDDEWYNIDVTWDDYDDYVLHLNFLASDDTMYEIGHVSDDWDIIGSEETDACVSKKYETGYVFNNLLYPVSKENGKLIFVSDGYKFVIENLKSKGMFFSLPKDGNEGVCKIKWIMSESYNSPFGLYAAEFVEGKYRGVKILNSRGIVLERNQNSVHEFSLDISSGIGYKIMMIDSEKCVPLIKSVEVGDGDGI